MTRTQLYVLNVLLLACVAASLVHFVHNAEFLDEYPNLPAWLSRSTVYLSWLGVTSVGMCGWWLARTRFVLVGLMLLAIYAVLGLDGLAHYAAAPPSAHTFTMNLTIVLEAVTSTILLAALGSSLCRGYAKNVSRRGPDPS